MARIQYLDPVLDPAQDLVLPLSPGYSTTAEVANELLTLALVHSEWPLVIDASGELHRLPSGSVRSITTWATECDLVPARLARLRDSSG